MEAEAHLQACLAQAQRDCGEHLPIFVKKGYEFDHQWEQISGCYWPLGVSGPHFLGNGCVELHQPVVVVCRDELRDDYAWLVPVMEELADKGRSLLVVAPRIAGQVGAILAVNYVRQTLAVAAVHFRGESRASDIDSTLQSICSLTGATIMSNGATLAEKHLGAAEKVWTNRDHLLIEPVDAGQGQHSPTQAILFSVGGETPHQIDRLLPMAARMALQMSSES